MFLTSSFSSFHLALFHLHFTPYNVVRNGIPVSPPSAHQPLPRLPCECAKASPKYLVHLWSFLGAFCGLCVVQAIFNYSQYFIARGVPGLIASYGASAVLVYGAIESPLAQPRALIFGHFFSALVGLCITKLFSLIPSAAKFDSLRWLAASLSSAVAIVVMQITETTHPPAGATALLPAVDEAVWALSWYYLPVVLLSSAMILAVALVVNNIQRRYPVFWVSPPKPKPGIPQPNGAK